MIKQSLISTVHEVCRACLPPEFRAAPGLITSHCVIILNPKYAQKCVSQA